MWKINQTKERENKMNIEQAKQYLISVKPDQCTGERGMSHTAFVRVTIGKPIGVIGLANIHKAINDAIGTTTAHIEMSFGDSTTAKVCVWTNDTVLHVVDEEITTMVKEMVNDSLTTYTAVGGCIGCGLVEEACQCCGSDINDDPETFEDHCGDCLACKEIEYICENMAEDAFKAITGHSMPSVARA